MRQGPEAALLATALALTACGGGSSMVRDDGPEPPPTMISSMPTEPVETAAEQAERADRIVAEADSLIQSDLRYRSRLGDASEEGRATPDCSDTRCTATPEVFGVPVPRTREAADYADFGPLAIAGALRTQHGITTVRVGALHNDENLDLTFTYGAWMSHAGFAVESVTGTLRATGDATITQMHGVAAGNLTGSAPGASMTWTGVAVGGRVANTLTDTFHATARLRYVPGSAGTGTLDARFTDFIDADSGRPRGDTLPGFQGVPVTADGRYETGASGNYIRGAFYGPTHAETAGVFEQDDMLGAFGAHRN